MTIIATETTATPTADTMAEEVVVSRDRKSLLVAWPGGRTATLQASALRSACRCAWCTHDRIIERFSVDDVAVEVRSVDALGSHGLHLRFSDGHQRGIFPWPYLAQLAEAATPGTNASPENQSINGAAA